MLNDFADFTADLSPFQACYVVGYTNSNSDSYWQNPGAGFSYGTSTKNYGIASINKIFKGTLVHVSNKKTYRSGTPTLVKSYQVKLAHSWEEMNYYWNIKAKTPLYCDTMKGTMFAHARPHSTYPGTALENNVHCMGDFKGTKTTGFSRALQSRISTMKASYYS